MILMALDRDTVRSKDRDARLHVETSHIAKACVSPYYGREIPGWNTLGLDPDRVYQMFRDPEELEKAVDTFNNLPILIRHQPTHAQDHPQELVVGTLGSGAKWNDPFIDNSLAIWTQEAIDLIEDDEQRELSPGYHYRADMTAGEYDNIAYDGIMRDIVGNHVALVTEGRQGPDVIVGDEHMLKSRKAIMVSGAVAALVRPKLAQDARIDLAGLFGGITAKNLAKKRTPLAKAIVSAVTPHLAQDEELDVDGVCKVIDAVRGADTGEDEDEDEIPDADKPEDGGDVVEDDDDGAKIAALLDYLKGKLSEEDHAEAVRLLNGDAAEDEDPEAPEEKREEDKPAMDAATVRSMIAEAEKRGARRQALIEQAKEDVFPIVGRVIAQDSAEAIYRMALDTAGYKEAALKGASVATLKAMVEREVAHKSGRPRMAQDSVSARRAADSFAELYGSK